MSCEDYNWAAYHANHSNSKNYGWLRYWLDRFDIHPKQKLRLIQTYLYSVKTGSKVLVYVHIPKTGGTSVTSGVHADWFVTLNHMLLRENLTDQFIPIGLMGTKWQPSTRHVLFTTVRNPLTFFRSYYHHVIGHGQHHNHEHYDFKTAQKGFDYLMRVIIDRDDFWPSRKFLYPQLFNQSGQLIVNWINRTESLNEDMKCLMTKMGYPFTPLETKRAAPIKELSSYYSDHLMNQVSEVYSREFEAFGYVGNGDVDRPLLVQDVSLKSATYDYISDQFNWGK